MIVLRKDWHMALRFGLMVPQGWRLDLLGIADPIEAYETMPRVAQIAGAKDLDSIKMFAQECIHR